jgi:hypothetical protein
VAEGAPLLREYAGKNLHPGFESLSLRQDPAAFGRLSSFPSERAMPTDFASILLLVLTSAVTFTIARLLSRNWRRKRRERDLAERRATESRQVRRARERRQRGK